MCIKKKPRMELEVGFYQCKRCGAVAKKKKPICKPKKVKKA